MLLHFFPSSLTMVPNKLEWKPFPVSLRIWKQGQSQPNWSTLQMLPSWVSSWCYQQMLDYTEKWLPVMNTLAYLASSSATKEKSFITSITWSQTWASFLNSGNVLGRPEVHPDFREVLGPYKRVAGDQWYTIFSLRRCWFNQNKLERLSLASVFSLD